MEIGILTFHFANNFGAVLQAFALKEVLSNIHPENTVRIVNYANGRMLQGYSINPFRHNTIKSIAKYILLFPKKLRQKIAFNRFREKYLELKGSDSSTLNLSGLEVVIVGSDQVWNMDITYGDLNYFLNNVDKQRIKCFSYAASSNDYFVPEKQLSQVAVNLSGFIKVAVREKQLQKQLLEKCAVESIYTVDPVYLRSKEEWSAFAGANRYARQKYILLYVLEYNENLELTVKYLQKTTNYLVYQVHPTGERISKIGKSLNGVGPNEFVALLRDAEIVVSNSFHAFAFAHIFEKKIYFDYFGNTSNRIKNLINIYKLEVRTDNSDTCFYISFEHYNGNMMKKLKNESMEYIETMLK